MIEMKEENDTYKVLTFGERQIILIGTAHVSRESIEEVRQVILKEKPAQVCVELDAGRYASMVEQDQWEKLDMIKVFKEGRGFLLMANLVLAAFQRRMGQEVGVKPGDEMKGALETARELGIPHVLCDREVQVTLRRAWSKCGWWSKCKLLSALLASAFSSEKLRPEEIENLKKKSELDGMMAELSEYLPAVKETLIDERDRYLAAKIWAAGAPRQVAVVGAGHLLGIKAHLEAIASGREAQDSQEISTLDTIPPAPLSSKLLPWLIPLLLLVLIALGFTRSGAQASLAMLLRWALLNGSLAAVGAIVALAHPLAVLASFFGAPLATANPFIGVGLFSGLTQVTLRKPRVTDAQRLTEDASSLKGLYRNRITHALLVFVLSTIGGAVGNFISIPTLAELLVKDAH